MRTVLLLVVGLVAALALAGPPQAVHAHADYDRSDPAAGARITGAPARVDIWFTQPLFRRVGANTIVVTDANGARVDVGEAVLDDSDRTHMSVQLRPDLPDGQYTVGWMTLSATDGDPFQGTFTFTIDRTSPPATGTAPTTPAVVSPTTGAVNQPPRESITDGGSNFPWWAGIAAAAILAAGGIGAWAMLSREPE